MYNTIVPGLDLLRIAIYACPARKKPPSNRRENAISFKKMTRTVLAWQTACGRKELEGLRGGDADGGAHCALPRAVAAFSSLDMCRQRCAKIPAAGAILYSEILIKSTQIWDIWNLLAQLGIPVAPRFRQ